MLQVARGREHAGRFRPTRRAAPIARPRRMSCALDVPLQTEQRIPIGMLPGGHRPVRMMRAGSMHHRERAAAGNPERASGSSRPGLPSESNRNDWSRMELELKEKNAMFREAVAARLHVWGQRDDRDRRARALR